MVRKKAIELLNNFDFDDSIDFIRKYGNPEIAEKVLSLARSSFTESKLESELKRISVEFVDREPVSVDIKIDARQIVPPNRVLEIFKTQRNNIVKHRDHLRGQLELINSNEERLEVALKIMSLTKKLADVWIDINTVESGRELPKEDDQDELTQVFEGVSNPLQIEKIRKNYVTYRSKARKGDRPAEKLSFYESVIKEAERRLNAI